MKKTNLIFTVAIVNILPVILSVLFPTSMFRFDIFNIISILAAICLCYILSKDLNGSTVIDAVTAVCLLLISGLLIAVFYAVLVFVKNDKLQNIVRKLWFIPSVLAALSSLSVIPAFAYTGGFATISIVLSLLSVLCVFMLSKWYLCDAKAKVSEANTAAVSGNSQLRL